MDGPLIEPLETGAKTKQFQYKTEPCWRLAWEPQQGVWLPAAILSLPLCSCIGSTREHQLQPLLEQHVRPLFQYFVCCSLLSRLMSLTGIEQHGSH